MIFFSISLWSEVLYGTLLLGLLLISDRSREFVKLLPRMVVGAALVGFLRLCRAFLRCGHLYVAHFCLCFVVAAVRRCSCRTGGHHDFWCGAYRGPHSNYISEKFDSRIISDWTLGQMMWLGNNDFTPVTFDYGNGYLSQRAYNRQTRGVGSARRAGK